MVPLVEKYAPSKSWHVETFTTMLSIAGNECPDVVWQMLITLIGQPESSDFRASAVAKLYDACMEDTKQIGLVKASIWVLGEFANYITTPNHPEGKDLSEEDVLDLLERIRKLHNVTKEVKAMVLNSYLKLATRFQSPESQQRIKSLVSVYKSSMTLELQARSVEYLNILDDQFNQEREEWLATMPVPTDEQLAARKIKFQNADGPESDDDEDDDYSDEEDESDSDDSDAPKKQKKVKAQESGDLLDLNDILGGGSSPQPSQPAPANAQMDLLADVFGSSSIGTSAPAAAPQQGSNDLLDMLGPGPSTAQGTSSNMDDLLGSMSASSPSFPPLNVYNQNGISVVFTFTAANNETVALATYSNANQSPVTGFQFEAAVPKYVQMKINPPSGSTLAPGSSNVTQSIRLINSQKGVKPLLMKVKLSYTLNGANKTEQLTVNNFPQGL